MSKLDTFTSAQNYTYNRIQELEKTIDELLDPTTFVLNSKVLHLQSEIDELQNECDHIFQNGICIVCGSEEKCQK